MKRFLLAFALLFGLMPVAFAAPLMAPCTETGPSASRCDPVNSTNPLPVTSSGGSPSTATTTTTNSTISVTNTFQAALAASSTRKSCLLQNTSIHVQYVYFGTIGSATTSNAFQISPGQTISCATVNGLVLTDAVNITGTAGDGYVVTNQ